MIDKGMREIMEAFDGMMGDSGVVDEGVDPLVKADRLLAQSEGGMKQIRSSLDKFRKGGERMRPQLTILEQEALKVKRNMELIIRLLGK